MMHTDNIVAEIRPAAPRAWSRLARQMLLLTLATGVPVWGSLTGPFVGCQEASAPVAVLGGTTFQLQNGNQHPVPMELQPAGSFSFHQVPGTSILESRWVNPPANCASALSYHEIPATSGANLIQLRHGLCIPAGIGDTCYYERPQALSPQRLAAVKEITPPGSIQRVLWVDLTLTSSPPGGDVWSSHVSPIQVLSYSPSGDAAVVQHDFNNGVNDPNWAVIDLCPGSVGSVLANVVDQASPVTVEVVQRPDTTIVTRITDAVGSTDVLLPDCLSPPPPPPTDARLEVTATGPGNGIVTGVSISCATDGNPNQCLADYPLGTMVSLLAAGRNQGAVFLGWSGDCPDTGNSTTLDMSADRTCTATFDEVRAEVALTLQGTPTPAIAGDTFLVDATVANNGPDTADNVTVLLTPPIGTTVASAQLPASCTHVLPANLVECSLGAVAAGSSGIVAIPFDVDPFTRGQIVTAANAASITWDPNLSDNSFSLTTMVIVSADLSLIKTASPVSVPRGTLQVYRLEVTNSGPSASSAATVIDTLPGFIFWRVNPNDPTPNLAMGPLAPGLSSVAMLLTDVDPGAPIGQILVNVADVAGADPDPNVTNNSDGVTTTVVGPRTSGSTIIELVADASTPVIGGSQLVGFHWHPALDGTTVAFAGQTTPGGPWGIYRSVEGRVIEVATTATTAPHGRSSFDELFTEKLSATGDDVGFTGTASQVTIPGYFRTSPGFLAAVADDTTVGSIVSVFGGELRGTEAILLLSTDTTFHGLVRTDGTSWTVLLESLFFPGLGRELVDVPSWDGATVAFWGSLFSSSTGLLEDGIYAIRDDTLVTVADTTTIVPGGVGTFTSFQREVSVDGDLVAFVGRDANNSYGVYVANVATGSLLVVANTNTTIPGTQLSFDSFFVGQSNPSVSVGRVAFAGRSMVDPTQGGIYLWEAGALSEVVQLLEPLPPSGGPAFGLLGRDSLDGDRLAFGNGLGVWIATLPQTLIFSDGFESGDTLAW